MSVKTFAGIDNFFFLEKMYGTTDIFSNAELYLLSVFWADCRVNLEIKSPIKVISKPKRWEHKSIEETYIYITLQGVADFESNLKTSFYYKNLPLHIIKGDWKILKSSENSRGQKLNMLELFFDDEQWFRCKFVCGRIQNTSDVPH